MIRRIPLRAYPDVTQQCELDGQTYTFRFRYNERAECWHCDLSTVDGIAVASGVKLVTAFPLLRRCLHPQRPPGELYMVDLQGRDAEPTLAEFGTRFALMYIEAGTAA